MNMIYYLFSFVVFQHIDISKSHSDPGLRQIIGKTNKGCELTFDTQVVFQTNALIFYSQILVKNSLEDIKNLVWSLSDFISNCCKQNAGEDCNQDKNSIFIDRVCEDTISQAKNDDIRMCCSKKYIEREQCFRAVQNGPPVKMPEIDTSVPFWTQCLEFITDQQTFMETYIYSLSRHYRIFPPRTMAKIIFASLRTYHVCCKVSTSLYCIDDMEHQNKKNIKNVTEVDNTICTEYKRTGTGQTILWGIKYFTMHHPVGLMGNAAEFATTYQKFSSQCCDETKWTSDCFLDESEVLLLQFCSKSSSAAQVACCQMTGTQRSECLDNAADEEAQTISREIYVTSEQLCSIHNAPDGRLIIWYTYEYTRRKRNDSLDVVLKSVSELGLALKLCCQDQNKSDCFSTHLAPLSFSILSQ
ncbi:hypothetical protein XENTR_v10001019 [Xenopus tropicalis]|uniref:Serum albumin isoform X1 n=3 Tax=Xenopus tropicalis TaxID=8364 RepID=A0A8J0SB78_XENTR|nr:serum albumin isoform X1 [Xenopus tropicalis]KAE8630924.1 hypothetical protein XENTR_v10001019 [Xenopus tropicalis]